LAKVEKCFVRSERTDRVEQRERRCLTTSNIIETVDNRAEKEKL
jgi:hypothetical protein